MKKEFLISFQISRLIIFEVNYYTLSTNEKAHFTTSSAMFIRSKRDYSTCGQCQDNILPKLSSAYKFYKKWDSKHLQDLSIEEYNEMVKDVEVLKSKYNYIEKQLDETKKPYNPHITFDDVVELSKRRLKK